MVCPQCGNEVRPGARFCPHCRAPLAPSPSGAAQPVLRVDGPSGSASYPLSPGPNSIGRTPDNRIPLVHEQVSRHHADVSLDPQGNLTIADLGSTNGVWLRGVRLGLRQPEPIHDGDQATIGPFTLTLQAAGAAQPAVAPVPPSLMPARPPAGQTQLAMPGQAAGGPQTGSINLAGKTVIKIGRAPDNDLVIAHPQASRYHAIVEQSAGAVKITDLGSTNGTMVNGQRITSPRVLHDGDVVQIATYRLVLQAGQIQHEDQEGYVTVDALHLTRKVGKGVTILTDVSLAIPPREFVAIVGGSGAGKSTLLDALNGFRPASEGVVLYNGMNLYENYDAFRNVIGYVPQDDIIHRELTIYGALDYAARLRLPRDTTPEERHKRIEEVLDDLGLRERRDTPIGKLSGGQRKRASIGVELLTRPSLFFLDEPTSGLDPSTETKMMKLMRELADQGRTVLLVTHVTNNVTLCDKVIIMARGGRVAYYGPPKEALAFFGVRDFVDIYDQLEKVKPDEWEKKFQKTPQFQQYVAQPLVAEAQNLQGARATHAKPGFKRISALRQFLILSQRNLEILYRDKASLVLMLLLAPLIGAMDLVTWNSDLFTTTRGNAGQIVTAMFMSGLITILVGSIASMREIVKETEIYKRERMVGLGIVPYIFSKVWFGVLLALYQAFVLVFFLVISIRSMNADPTMLVQMYITLALATLSGMMIGLFVSAVAPNQNVAPLLIILFLVPQFFFSGGMLPVNTLPGGPLMSMTTSTKWAMDSLITISRMGQDVAHDPCYQVESARESGVEPQEGESDIDVLERWQDSLSEQSKGVCTCLGPNVFKACKFPGVAKKLTTDEQTQVVSAEPPKPATPKAAPAAPGDPPATPVAPPKRPQCDPQTDQACAGKQNDWGKAMDNWQRGMDTWTSQMSAWQDKMTQWQDSMEAYKTTTDQYKSSMDKWQDAYTAWKSARDTAIKRAEGLIRAVFENYGEAFDSNLVVNWSALGIIIAVFFAAIFVTQKAKDNAGK